MRGLNALIGRSWRADTKACLATSIPTWTFLHVQKLTNNFLMQTPCKRCLLLRAFPYLCNFSYVGLTRTIFYIKLQMIFMKWKKKKIPITLDFQTFFHLQVWLQIYIGYLSPRHHILASFFRCKIKSTVQSCVNIFLCKLPTYFHSYSNTPSTIIYYKESQNKHNIVVLFYSK